MSAPTLDRPKTTKKQPAAEPLSFTVNAPALSRLLKNAAVAAGLDRTLPVLAAVRLSIDTEGRLVSQGTDRYSLVQQRHTLAGPDESVSGDTTTDLIIPVADLPMVCWILARAGKIGTVTVRCGTDEAGRRVAHFAVYSYRLTIDLIDGEYPRVSTLLDKALAGENIALPDSRALQPKYLARLDKIKLTGLVGIIGWQQHATSVTAPTVWRPAGPHLKDDIVMLIMPTTVPAE